MYFSIGTERGFNVSQYIIDVLKHKNITQYQLAKKIGVSENGLSKMLKVGDMKISTMLKIAEALEFPIENYFYSKFYPSDVDNVDLFLIGKKDYEAPVFKNNIPNKVTKLEQLELENKELKERLNDKEKLVELFEERFSNTLYWFTLVYWKLIDFQAKNKNIPLRSELDKLPAYHQLISYLLKYGEPDSVILPRIKRDAPDLYMTIKPQNEIH